MNPEYINTLALWVGFAALGALVLLVLAAGYLTAYELVKKCGERILLPLWLYHFATIAVRLRQYRPDTKKMTPEESRSLVCRFILNEVHRLEREHPEMKGLLKELLR